jgi:hypothetical protein
MPMVLADAKIKLSLLAVKPANPEAPTVAELTAGIDASCRILQGDFRLSATSSDTIEDRLLCAEGNATVWGASNYEGSMTPVRFFDPTNPGTFDPESDAVYQALKEKGTTLFVAQRFTGKKFDEPWAAGDEVKIFEVLTDNPQQPSELTGYIKQVVPLGVNNAWTGNVAAAGA